jgi:hypothetical protein
LFLKVKVSGESDTKKNGFSRLWIFEERRQTVLIQEHQSAGVIAREIQIAVVENIVSSGFVNQDVRANTS